MKTDYKSTRKIKGRLLFLLLAAAMAFTLLPTAAQAAQGNDFAVTGDPAGYTYEADGKLTFIAPGDYTVTMATPSSSTTTDTIAVDVNESSTVNPVNITLQDVSINVSATFLACAFDIKDGSTVSLTLNGINILTSGYNTAGLHVPSGATLIISGDGTLTANGGGTTDIMKNDGGAGIGSSTEENSGAVTINGGTIIANGAQYSAGIGGGYHGTNGTVDISGGTVTANGQNGSAGIGGGSSGSGGTINISGGTVTATGYSVGIGSCGETGRGTIIISGGTITATSLSWGSGIGSGAYYTGTDNTIMISGGTVNAIANTHGAGIGGGFRGNGGTILITGGTVTAQGGKYGAGIGGGRYDGWAPDSYRYNITISSGMVNAAGGQGGAGIGGGFDGKDGVDVSGGTITISGGTITAVGGDAVTTSTDGAPTSAGGGAGIGGGCNGGGGNVYISGGSVKAVHGVCTGTGTSAEDIGKGYAGASDGCLKNFDTAEGADVYLTELTLGGVSAATAVSSIITDAAYTYGTGMQTDLGGKLYLYLPAGKKTTAAVTLPSALTYTGEVMTTTDPATSCGTLSPSADVRTYAEFTTAVADANFGTIDVIGSFALEGDVTIDRAVTITSANGSVIAAGSHCLLVSGAAANVTMSGNLTVTGSGTVISVSADSEFTLTGGTVSASGNNSRGIFVQSKGVMYINGGSVSAGGENAYGILLGTGDYMANLYIDMSNTPSIDEIYFDSAVPNPTSFLTSFPAPFSAVLGETTTVTLTGVGDGADFQVHTIGAAPPPGTSETLNADEDYDNTFTVTPSAVGNYRLVFSGSTARSNIYITIPVTVTSGFAGGDGTAVSPFQIVNIEQLNLVRKFLGSEHTNKYFKLTENINLGVAPYNTGEGWEPIGDNIIGANNLFQEYFDGNGKTISGLFINRTDDSVGLFGACSDANIQNLGLSGVNITSNDSAGSLTGYLGEASAVTNCYATGAVTGENSTAGGLVGAISSSTITDSYAACSVTGNIAGGLVGSMGGTSSITNSYVAGSVTGTYAGGGLVGHNPSGGTVTASCYNSQTSGQSDSDGRGEPKSSFDMVRQTTYSGWDFTQGTGDWNISEGVSYPYLQALVPASLPAPPVTTSARVVENSGDPRYSASTKTLTMTYGDSNIASFSAENVTPADGLVIWSNSDTAVADIDDHGDGSVSVEAVGAGTATISLKSVNGNTLDSVTVIVELIPLTVTGDFEVENKEYDGSANAFITNTTLSLDTTGCISGDEVNLTANFAASFSDPDAGQNKNVSLSASTLTGSAAGNYVLDFSLVPTTTASITPKELTIGGSFTAQSKVYDGTTGAAIALDNLTLVGKVGSDDVTLVPVLAFDTPDIATGKTVSLTTDSYLTGAKAGNYTLSLTGAPTYTSGVIADKQATLGGSFTVNNKEYSGGKAATIATNNLTLVGVHSGDDVSIASVTAEFDSASAGNGKTVRIKDVTLTGANAGNYAVSLTGAPTASANITAKPLTITGSFTVKDRQYDGTANAEIDTGTLTLNGIIGSDTVNLNASAVFDDANVGTGKTVTLTGSTLTGDDAANYALDFTGAPITTANITRATGLQAPAAPTLKSKTSTSVTLTPNVEQEFSKDNGISWQMSNVFTGLTPSTEYSFITRVKDDANHEASPASAMLTVTTDASSSTDGGPSGSNGGNSTSGGSGSTSSAGRLEIPSSFILNPNSGKTLTLGNDFASVTIPSDMLDNIPVIVGKKVEISIGQGDKSGLPDDVKAAIGDRPLISLSLLIDGKQTDWSNPDAPVTVSIPYMPTADELKNPDSIVVWYIDGSGNPQCVANGHYDPATGAVTFDVTHFSNYAVVYNPVSFNDVKSGAWYYKAVSFIAARDITRGTGSGNFSPDAKLTRGDFLVMLMKAYGIAPDTSPADNFSDAGNTYYTGYLAAAKRLGISAGVGNNMYAPGKEITRQEMFTLLYNALKVIGRLPQGDSGKTLSDFSDAGQIDSWAKEALTLLVETGTVGGNAGKLSPTGTTTRAEMAQVLYNLLGK